MFKENPMFNHVKIIHVNENAVLMDTKQIHKLREKKLQTPAMKKRVWPDLNFLHFFALVLLGLGV